MAHPERNTPVTSKPWEHATPWDCMTFHVAKAEKLLEHVERERLAEEDDRSLLIDATRAQAHLALAAHHREQHWHIIASMSTPA